VIQQSNVALYAMYAGDFGGAAAMAKKVVAEQPTYVNGYLPLAIDALSRGDDAAASRAYDDMAKAGARGASLASTGRADLALYVGHAAAAERELDKTIQADLDAKNSSGAALKYLVLAEARAAQGKKPQAIDAVTRSLALTHSLETLLLAARVNIALGRIPEARALAAELDRALQKQNRAYAKVALAEIALSEKKTSAAVDLLGQAQQLSDVWLAHFDLGVAFVQAGHFAEAVSELEACEKRRGEATALFLDEVPTVRYLASLPYWIGRAQEGLGMAAPAKARYEAFLALRKDSADDALVADARRRIGGR